MTDESSILDEIGSREGGLAVFSASDLLAKEFTPPKWAVDGILPEGVTLLVGRPKQGKSWLALGIGIAVGTGGRALSTREVSQGSVLYLALEDNERRLQKRCRKLLQGNPCHGLDFTIGWAVSEEGLKRWNTLLLMQDRVQARLSSLATKLRISPQTRTHKDRAGTIFQDHTDAPRPWNFEG
jgi:hypothetical protein